MFWYWGFWIAAAAFVAAVWLASHAAHALTFPDDGCGCE